MSGYYLRRNRGRKERGKKGGGRRRGKTGGGEGRKRRRGGRRGEREEGVRREKRGVGGEEERDRRGEQYPPPPPFILRREEQVGLHLVSVSSISPPEVSRLLVMSRTADSTCTSKGNQQHITGEHHRELHVRAMHRHSRWLKMLAAAYN